MKLKDLLIIPSIGFAFFTFVFMCCTNFRLVSRYFFSFVFIISFPSMYYLYSGSWPRWRCLHFILLDFKSHVSDQLVSSFWRFSLSVGLLTIKYIFVSSANNLVMGLHVLGTLLLYYVRSFLFTVLYEQTCSSGQTSIGTYMFWYHICDFHFTVLNEQYYKSGNKYKFWGVFWGGMRVYMCCWHLSDIILVLLLFYRTVRTAL